MRVLSFSPHLGPLLLSLSPPFFFLSLSSLPFSEPFDCVDPFASRISRDPSLVLPSRSKKTLPNAPLEAFLTRSLSTHFHFHSLHNEVHNPALARHVGPPRFLRTNRVQEASRDSRC